MRNESTTSMLGRALNNSEITNQFYQRERMRKNEILSEIKDIEKEMALDIDQASEFIRENQKDLHESNLVMLQSRIGTLQRYRGKIESIIKKIEKS